MLKGERMQIQRIGVFSNIQSNKADSSRQSYMANSKNIAIGDSFSFGKTLPEIPIIEPATTELLNKAHNLITSSEAKLTSAIADDVNAVITRVKEKPLHKETQTGYVNFERGHIYESPSILQVKNGNKITKYFIDNRAENNQVEILINNKDANHIYSRPNGQAELNKDLRAHFTTLLNTEKN